MGPSLLSAPWLVPSLAGVKWKKFAPCPPRLAARPLTFSSLSLLAPPPLAPLLYSCSAATTVTLDLSRATRNSHLLLSSAYHNHSGSCHGWSAPLDSRRGRSAVLAARPKANPGVTEGANTLKRDVLPHRAAPSCCCVPLLGQHWTAFATATSKQTQWGDATARRGSTLVAASLRVCSQPELHPREE